MRTKQGVKEAYCVSLRINENDTFSKAVLGFAHRGAEPIEIEIGQGKEVGVAAEKTICIAKETGITRFMEDLAVEFLGEYWEYGEHLRAWHNEKYRYSGFGTYIRLVELYNKPVPTKEELEELVNELLERGEDNVQH